MFVGHAGCALLAAGGRARPPLVVLLLAAYGPDWLELPWRLAGSSDAHIALASHSLVSTAIAGGLAGLYGSPQVAAVDHVVRVGPST